MRKKHAGDLLIIGGHEQKESDEDRAILSYAAKKAKAGKGHMVLLTVASEEPKALAETYRKAFGRLGVNKLEVLDIRTRDEAYEPGNVKKVEDASVLFFTGGDQLRISSQLGGSPLLEHIVALHKSGTPIVGTSAGAACMSETMLIGGPTNNSCLATLAMAPGLGLLEGVIVDSHFAERGRFGRLMGAVAQNPHNLGIGIDEDTAIHVTNDEEFTVLGSGAVYIIDGSGIRYTNLSDRQHAERIFTIHDARVHILGRDDRFSLKERKPVPPPTPVTG
jgi:cyanophycinase